jgi:hypothetical protein
MLKCAKLCAAGILLGCAIVALAPAAFAQQQTSTVAQSNTQPEPTVSLAASDAPDLPDAPGPPGGGSAADLAKKLQNPIASLISVPFQNNLDYGGGPSGHGSQYLLNIQPVIPFALGTDWNLIVRTIIPVTQINYVQPQNVGGLGDIVQSFFLAPSHPVYGLIVGAGPVFSYPTGTDDRISANQFAAGPTVVVLKQAGGWTFGALANHLWGFGAIGHNGYGGDTVVGLDGFTTVTPRGRSDRVDSTYVQPFVSYTFATRTTLSVSAESSYNWTASTWTVPVIAGASQLLKIGSQPISIGLSGKYSAAQPAGAPDWGVRLTLTLLFPK